MACDSLVYSGVGESKWATVKDAVRRKYGIRIDSAQGAASRRGFTLKWAYESHHETLRIQCLRKPFFVSCGRVNRRIQQMAQECGIASP